MKKKQAKLFGLKLPDIKIFILLDIVLASILTVVIFGHKSSTRISNVQPSQTEENKSAHKIYAICTNLQQDKQTCYAKQFIQLTRDKSLSFSQNALYTLQTIDPAARSCHQLAHQMAQAQIRQNPQDWKAWLSKVNANDCGGGFIHGILEGRAGYDPNFTINPQLIAETCVAKSQCFHIFGHLALFQSEGNIQPALDICRALDKKVSFECFNGMFMEDTLKTTLLDHGIVSNIKNPTRDKVRLEEVTNECFSFKDIEAGACWANLGPIFAEFYKFDYEQTFVACQKAPEQQQRHQCYARAVAQIIIQPDYSNQDKLLKLCSVYEAKSSTREHCVTYLAASLVYNSLEFATPAIEFCSNVETAYQDKCFKAIGGILKDSISSPSNRDKICQIAPDEFKNGCINGDPSVTPFGLI